MKKIDDMATTIPTDEALDVMEARCSAARKRADAATKGPWVQWKGHDSILAGPARKNTSSHFSGTRSGKDAGFELTLEDDCPNKKNNARFVIHARMDVPALSDDNTMLLAAVRTLKKQIAELEEMAEIGRTLLGHANATDGGGTP